MELQILMITISSSVKSSASIGHWVSIDWDNINESILWLKMFLMRRFSQLYPNHNFYGGINDI